jgi:uncharacterized protein (UPF0332 family)
VTNELIHSYLTKARGKLRVALELHHRGDSDDAVSRAYYAAFHAAQAALLTEGQRADTHRGVVVLFGLLLVKPGKLDRRWGKFLANLKDDRETGDYDPLSYIDEVTAERAVAEAEGFVEAIERYVTSLQE